MIKGQKNMRTEYAKSEFWRGGEKNSVIVISIAVILVLLVSLVKYRGEDVNYCNSDATWHALLTIEAYSETPKSQHLFLPIVTLGSPDDKWIPWGATIPDDEGNYYYTSFSPAGYFLAWMFLKIFHLPVAEKSLYIYNTMLFAVSAAVWGWLVSLIYEKSSYRRMLSIISIITYVLSPELLHGMGVVYWAQSVMQVTLLLQISAYYVYKRYDSRAGRMIFYLLALVNPYIEWTGYVANAGFALMELFWFWKEDKKKGVVRGCTVGMITLCSFAVFVGHYLLRVDSITFFKTLYARFCSRNVAVEVSLVELFSGYLKSFLWLWTLLLLLIVWNFLKCKRIELKHGAYILLLVFPLLENILMKQHAISYSFDRMKFVFVLSFLICELTDNLLERGTVRQAAVLLVLTLGFGGLNLRGYMRDSTYVWDIDFKEDNQVLADYLNQNYLNSVFAIEGYPVRGYVNLLFQRGVYEFTGLEKAQELAVSRGKRYVVMPTVEDYGAQVYDFGGASIYDMQTGITSLITVSDGKISVQDFVNGQEAGTY